MWIAGCTRQLHRKPMMVLQWRAHLLRDLQATASGGLVYKILQAASKDSGEARPFAKRDRNGPPGDLCRFVLCPGRELQVQPRSAHPAQWHCGHQSVASLMEWSCRWIGFSTEIARLRCSWRTRHLRLRAAKLREALRDESSRWSAWHLSGTCLVDDSLTKSLLGQAFGQQKQVPKDFETAKKDSGVAEEGSVSFRSIGRYFGGEVRGRSECHESEGQG